MRKLSFLPLMFVIANCSTSDKIDNRPPEFHKKYPVVTIETSGDLYYEEGGGENVQMDVFGNCSPGQTVIYVEVDNKKSATDCKKGRYRFAMNLPKSFFKYSEASSRAPSSKYLMKEISAYHLGHKNLSATSYILIDKKRREVKSVINKQVKFEKIPTGDYEPVTQFNAFGSCTTGSLVTIDITSPDRYGHQVSKYDEKKECQSSGGFYFLSQMHGYIKKGTHFKIYEDKALPVSPRTPASNEKPKFKNLFNWNLSVD